MNNSINQPKHLLSPYNLMKELNKKYKHGLNVFEVVYLYDT